MKYDERVLNAVLLLYGVYCRPTSVSVSCRWR